MKNRTALVVFTLAVASIALPPQGKAQDQSQKTSTASAETGQTQDDRTAKPPQSAASSHDKDAGFIPANAERIDATHFRVKDDKGVAWDYTKTPFGIVKRRADEKSSTTPNVTGWKATDLGDSVRFERQTAFGTSTWTKKKSDLNSTEKMALANATPTSAPSETPKQ